MTDSKEYKKRHKTTAQFHNIQEGDITGKIYFSAFSPFYHKNVFESICSN
jgi:hypothetical protein